jgi:hypothetical protein
MTEDAQGFSTGGAEDGSDTITPYSMKGACRNLASAEDVHSMVAPLGRLTATIFGGARLEIVVLVVVALTLVYQLLLEPIVGVADNRDYYRVMRQLGVAWINNPEISVFKNIERKFALGPPSEVQYVTSAVPLGRIALALNKLVSKDGLFDLRMLGVVNATCYLAALALFLFAFHKRGYLVRFLVSLACVGAFTDVRLVSYFNSFFSESAQLIFLISTVGLALHASQRQANSYRWLWYGAWFGSALCFCVAKSQNMVFCFPLGVLAARLVPRVRAATALRIIAGLSFVGLFGWAILSDAYQDTRHRNLSVVLNEEVLVHSPDPERDIQELAYTGTQALGFGQIVMFYARHSDRFLSLLERRMGMTFDYIPYGSFELPMIGVSHAFELWSEWKRVHYSRSLGFWVVGASAYLVLLGIKWRYVDANHAQRDRTLINSLLLSSCALQFLVVSMFEANGPKKHFFIFNVLVDLVCLLGVIDLCDLSAWLRGRFVMKRSLPVSSVAP